MTSLCLLFLGGASLLDHFLPPTPVPILFESFNRNQLLLFLIANLMTGLVNMSVDTLDQPDSVAFGILSLYLLIVSMVSLLIKVKIKLL
jgi:phosphatidylinositol glycan class W